MSKRQWLCVLGAWIMIFLFLGVPSMWHKILAILSGIIIISIAYNLPPDQKSSPLENDSVFVENNKTDTPKQ